ncbi:helix-turn-helix domain-containing protein [Patescibacteria group bacterium]|nr:helix-turn-helix domain-containing protein [Patescibacteria group bacterium]
MQSQISESEKMDYLSIGEASEYLGISIDTLRRWEKKERITAYRSPGGHRYFQKEDLKGLFNARYTRDAPTIRSKKGAEFEEAGTEFIEPIEDVITRPRIVVEEKSVEINEETEIIDWSHKYVNKEPRNVRIPLTQPIAIRTSQVQTISNHQSIQQVQPSPQSFGNILVPPTITQGTENNQLDSSAVQQSSLSSAVRQFNSPVSVQQPARQMGGFSSSAGNPLSKIQKVIIIVTLIIALICFVVFFYWYSQPRILSPIP